MPIPTRKRQETHLDTRHQLLLSYPSLTEADSFALSPRVTSRKWHAIKGDIEEALASRASCLQVGGKSRAALHKTADMTLAESGDKMPTCRENGGSCWSPGNSVRLGSRIPIYSHQRDRSCIMGAEWANQLHKLWSPRHKMRCNAERTRLYFRGWSGLASPPFP